LIKLVVDGRIMVRWMFKKQGAMMRSGFNWLETGCYDEGPEISWPPEQLSRGLWLPDNDYKPISGCIFCKNGVRLIMLLHTDNYAGFSCPCPNQETNLVLLRVSHNNDYFTSIARFFHKLQHPNIVPSQTPVLYRISISTYRHSASHNGMLLYSSFCCSYQLSLA
jgi:hypothetical protein